MLRFARNDGDFRNDVILDEILNEIAPSFSSLAMTRILEFLASVALLPFNDAENSKFWRGFRGPKGLDLALIKFANYIYLA